MPVVRYNVKARSESGSKTVVEVRGFKVVIDEPVSLGGTNEGPNPVEYLLASLSGCVNVVGHTVAKEMGFNLENLEMVLEGELDPGRVLGRSMAERAGFKRIKVSLKVDADADRATLEKWLKAVEDRCPVGDNLANATPLELSLE